MNKSDPEWRCPACKSNGFNTIEKASPDYDFLIITCECGHSEEYHGK